MNLDRTVTISPDVISQEVAGETVLLDLNSEHYFGLDAVGTRIWQLITDGGYLQTVFDTLLAEYDVSSEQLEEDLAALLDAITERGLATIASGAQSSATPQ